jgi:hypothetical protein
MNSNPWSPATSRPNPTASRYGTASVLAFCHSPFPLRKFVAVHPIPALNPCPHNNLPHFTTMQKRRARLLCWMCECILSPRTVFTTIAPVPRALKENTVSKSEPASVGSLQNPSHWGSHQPPFYCAFVPECRGRLGPTSSHFFPGSPSFFHAKRRNSTSSDDLQTNCRNSMGAPRISQTSHKPNKR